MEFPRMGESVGEERMISRTAIRQEVRSEPRVTVRSSHQPRQERVPIRNENILSMYVKRRTELKRQKSINTSQLQVKTNTRLRKMQFDKSRDQAAYHATTNPMKEFKRKSRRTKIMEMIKQHEGLMVFLAKVQELQNQFIDGCFEEDYNVAANVLIKLINYAVDCNLIDQFSKALKVLADFYLVVGKVQQSLFFYNEARQSCLLLSQPTLLIESLIGMANCCGKQGLEMEAITVLKKALQYSWLNDLKELQLRIYDEIGKQYYHLGDLQKAKKFHHRYINSLYEPLQSALKSLSRQRILKLQQLNIEQRYKELSILLLVHLKVPIRTLVDVPSAFFFPDGILSVRECFNISEKYFTHYQDVDIEIQKILKTWFFKEEIDEPTLPQADWTAPLKLKKFAYIDFKLNQHLSKLTKKVILSSEKKTNHFKVKESLEEQVARKIRQTPLRSDWYEKIVDQISRDHKNKLLNVRHAVRVRGHNKRIKPMLETVKDIYNAFFEGKTSQNENRSMISFENNIFV